jgi:hypothetical protein
MIKFYFRVNKIFDTATEGTGAGSLPQSAFGLIGACFRLVV